MWAACPAPAPSSSQRWGASGQQGCTAGGLWPNRSPALRFHHLSAACRARSGGLGKQGEDWGQKRGKDWGEESGSGVVTIDALLWGRSELTGRSLVNSSLPCAVDPQDHPVGQGPQLTDEETEAQGVVTCLASPSSWCGVGVVSLHSPVF